MKIALAALALLALAACSATPAGTEVYSGGSDIMPGRVYVVQPDGSLKFVRWE